MKKIKNRFLLFMAGLSLIICIFIIRESANTQEPIEQYISNTLKQCFFLREGQNTCIKKVAVHLVNRYSLPLTIQTLEKNNSNQYVNNVCHIMTHYLGQAQFDKTRSLIESLSGCTAYCSSGCFHGVAEQYLRTKYRSNTSFKTSLLIQDIRTVCPGSLQNQPNYCTNGFFVHGLGHVAAYMAQYDVLSALKVCEEININVKSCYNGVFMEAQETILSPNIQGPFEDLQKSLSFCNSLPQKHQEVCFEAIVLKNNPDNRMEKINMCKGFPKEYQQMCFNRIATYKVVISDFQQVKKYCDLISEDVFKAWCIQGVISSYVGLDVHDEIVANFCKLVDLSFKPACYAAIEKEWQKHNRNMQNICQHIEEKEYISLCL